MTMARVRCWTRTILVCQLIVLVFIIAVAHGLIVPLERPVTTDFISFYAAGLLANGPDPAMVYDRAAHYLAEQSATAPGIAYVHFFYPPVFLLVCGLLSHLPYVTAFLLFEISTTALCLLVVCLVGGDRRWVLPAVSFSPLLWNDAFGQNACLTAALFGLGTWLLQMKRPVLAGIVLGCLCYKPHVGLLIPVALVCGGHRKAFIGAAACVCCLGLSTLGLFGLESWRSFLVAIVRAQTEFSAGEIVPFTVTASVYGAFRLLGVDPTSALVLECLIGLLVVCGVAWSWRQPDDGSGSRNAVLIAGTLLIMPVVLFYDTVLLLIAAAWMTRTARMALPGEAFGLGLVWLAGLLCYPVSHVSNLPIAAASAALLFCLAVRKQARISAHLQKSNRPGPEYFRRPETIS